MLIDKDAGGGAAAEGFEPDGSGAGEKVEHAGVFHALTEDGEDRLADEVRGGTGDGGRHLDGDASGFSGDDSHEGVSAFEFDDRSLARGRPGSSFTFWLRAWRRLSSAETGRRDSCRADECPRWKVPARGR